MRGGGLGWEVEELSLVKDNREVMSSHPDQYVRKACQDATENVEEGNEMHSIGGIIESKQLDNSAKRSTSRLDLSS